MAWTPRVAGSLAKLAERLGLLHRTAISYFQSDQYLRHNARRLEHLASLGIAVRERRVLEVGAGIGDHSHYYLDRGCRVTITEGRRESLGLLARRYPTAKVQFLDMEHPSPLADAPFDIVHCYGLLYHLENPEQALRFMSESCRQLLLLETCVSFGDAKSINITEEPHWNPTQALSGRGCRPTRPWLFERLRSLFPYVYLPKTQPNHEEFPVDWTAPQQHRNPLARAVFVASREEIRNEQLSSCLLDHQARHA